MSYFIVKYLVTYQVTYLVNYQVTYLVTYQMTHLVNYQVTYLFTYQAKNQVKYLANDQIKYLLKYVISNWVSQIEIYNKLLPSKVSCHLPSDIPSEIQSGILSQ